MDVQGEVLSNSLTLGNKPAKMQETDSDSNEPDADFLSKIFLGVVS